MISSISYLIEKAPPVRDPRTFSALALLADTYGEKRANEEMARLTFEYHARQLLPLMYEVVGAAARDPHNSAMAVPTGHNERTYAALEALRSYCAQHLPKPEESP